MNYKNIIYLCGTLSDYNSNADHHSILGNVRNRISIRIDNIISTLKGRNLKQELGLTCFMLHHQKDSPP